MRDGNVPTLAEVGIRRKDAFWEAHCVRVHIRRYVHWYDGAGQANHWTPRPGGPPVRPGGSVCGTNGCWNEVFGERFTVEMKFDVSR